jgi:uncharacterized protein (TIGR03437 family)
VHRPLLFLAALAVPALYSQTYTISTLAGGGLPVNLSGTSASLDVPLNALASDSAGNLYFTYHDCVLRWDASTGMVTQFAGGAVSGFSGDGGPASRAQLSQPGGLAVDTAGNVYIADTGNYRIRKVSNGVITTVAGTGKQTLAAVNGPALTTGFSYPVGLALDATGNLYIVDQLVGSVRRLSNGQLTTVAGNGKQGRGGDNGPATSAQLADPIAVAVDVSGNLYISDYGSQSVRKVADGIITTVAGDGVQGYSDDNTPAIKAHLDNPFGIAVDTAGNLYIADVSNNVIRKVSNGVITTVAGIHISGFSGDNGPATSAQLKLPSQVAVTAGGILYIGDERNLRIRKVSSSGIITSIVGNGLQGFSGDGGPAVNAQLCNPVDLALDSTGAVFVSDICTFHIRKISGGQISTVAGDGTNGFTPDGVAAANAKLGLVTGIAAGTDGSLYLADADNRRLRKISDGIITTVAGDGAFGFRGDDGPATTASLTPSGLTMDAAGNLFVIDLGNNRIRRISNGIITTIAGNGTTGFSGDGGPATSAQLNLSYGVAGITVDAEGNVYIPDVGNNRIRKVSKGVITTVAGTGASGFSGDNGPAPSARLSLPKAVAVDASGNLYIADAGNGRIRKVSNGVITTIAGGGVGGLGDNGFALNAQLSDPAAIAVDRSGFLYIADRANARIRLLTPSGGSCSYSVSPTSLQAPSTGGNFSLSIQTAAACPWAIAGVPDWATANPSTSTGPATVTFTFAANSGPTRSADLSIVGTTVRLSQKSGASVPTIMPGGVVNAANFAALAPVAAGSIATVFGDFLSTPFTRATTATLPTSLAGVSIQIGGLAAPLFAVSSTQINFQVPWELASKTSVPLTVTVNGQTSAAETVSLAPVAPGIFTTDGQFFGQGAIIDENFRLVDATNPAIAGKTVLQIFCTGLGAVSNQPPTGSPARSDALSQTPITPVILIGPAQAQVLFSGLAPGSVGEYQINVLVPPGAQKGTAVPIQMFAGGGVPNIVTIAVQ